MTARERRGSPIPPEAGRSPWRPRSAGAFRDSAVAEVLELPADQTPVYIIPVGKPGS